MTCCSVDAKLETFCSAQANWESANSTCPTTTVFDTPVWQKAWWDHFGTGKEQRIISVNRDDGQMELLAPMMYSDGTVSFLGGTDLVDYHNFVYSDRATDECIEAVLRELSSDRSVNRILLESVVDRDLLERATNIAESLSWRIEIEQEDVSPRMELPGSWDEYLAGLRKKDRHELRRKMRRLEGAGDVRHVELSSREDIEAAADDFFQLHRQSTPDKNEFMTAEREMFFRDVAGRLADVGVTRLAFLELDGEKVRPWHIGPVKALILALALPICYGVWFFIKHKKLNFFSFVGLISVLLTGGLTLYL